MPVSLMVPRLLAAAVPLVLGIQGGALAQQERPPPSSALPPLPPPPAEPLSPPPPVNAKVDTVSQAPGMPLPPKPPPPSVATRAEPERRWYGWQIILTDAAALAPVALISNGGGWGDLALGLYLGGGPVVHGAHESGAKAAGSLGLRILGVLGGAGIGLWISAAAEHSGCESAAQSRAAAACSLVIGTEVGLVAGSLVASFVDVAVLAYDVRPTGSRVTAGPPALQLTPVAGFPRDSAGRLSPTFGLSGSF